MNILYFFSETCPGCPRIKPAVEKLKMNHHVQEIDAEKQPRIAESYGVQGLPTVIVVDKGKIVQRHTGVSKNIIRELETLL
jgi:thioredoxin-like negative regulator of GroEL